MVLLGRCGAQCARDLRVILVPRTAIIDRAGYVVRERRAPILGLGLGDDDRGGDAGVADSAAWDLDGRDFVFCVCVDRDGDGVGDAAAWGEREHGGGVAIGRAVAVGEGACGGVAMR